MFQAALNQETSYPSTVYYYAVLIIWSYNYPHNEIDELNIITFSPTGLHTQPMLS